MMAADLFSRILAETRKVDGRYQCENPLPRRLQVDVPDFHPRSRTLKRYWWNVEALDTGRFADALFLIDRNTDHTAPLKIMPISAKLVRTDATEKYTKDATQFRTFMKRVSAEARDTVVVVGGGILMNFGAAVAQEWNAHLILAPTTSLAMADASIGGKVRLNSSTNDRLRKHAIRTFYDPDEIIVDWRFLDSLPAEELRHGYGEIIKHAVFQSPALLTYLDAHRESLLSDRDVIRRVICWTAELKLACMRVDPLETPDGAGFVLRAAHDASDRIEERSGFCLPHGEAVLSAILAELLAASDSRFSSVASICQGLGISTAAELRNAA
jgi:3-dehydroquinate synthetase